MTDTRTTRYTYTPDGRIKNLTRPDLSTVSYDYYSTSGRLQTQTDSIGKLEHRYDSSGNLISLLDKASGSTLTSEFDSLNRLQSYTDSSGHRTSYYWLNNGLLRSVRYHSQRSDITPAKFLASVSNGSLSTFSLIGAGKGYLTAPRVIVAPPDSPGRSPPIPAAHLHRAAACPVPSPVQQAP